jgi:hypothetical protein
MTKTDSYLKDLARFELGLVQTGISEWPRPTKIGPNPRLAYDIYLWAKSFVSKGETAEFFDLIKFLIK